MRARSNGVDEGPQLVWRCDTSLARSYWLVVALPPAFLWGLAAVQWLLLKRALTHGLVAAMPQSVPPLAAPMTPYALPLVTALAAAALTLQGVRRACAAANTRVILGADSITVVNAMGRRTPIALAQVRGAEVRYHRLLRRHYVVLLAGTGRDTALTWRLDDPASLAAAVCEATRCQPAGPDVG